MSFPLARQEYEILHIIGKSAYDEIYLARALGSKKLAAMRFAQIRMNEKEEKQFHNEITYQTGVCHPNLVHYYGTFKSEGCLITVMELMSAGSLADILAYFSFKGIADEVLIASVLKPALEFLAFFHGLGYIHSNIRPQSILINTDGIVKVSNLQLSATLLEIAGQGPAKKRLRFSPVGIPLYTAPEVFSNTGYSEFADIWSIGITALELAVGVPPNHGLSEIEQMTQLQTMRLHEGEKGTQAPIAQSRSNSFSPEFRKFLNLCLQIDPNKRAPASKLLQTKFIKSAKNSKYIVRTLLSQLPPLFQRFALLHNNWANNKPPEFEGTAIHLPVTTPDEVVSVKKGRFTMHVRANAKPQTAPLPVPRPIDSS